MEKLHGDLKRLLADLNRLGNFFEYLWSEEFNNLLLENCDDEFWYQNMTNTGASRTSEYNKTYVNCLNYLLLIWLNKDGHGHIAKVMNGFVEYTIIGYIEFNEGKKDLSKLFQRLDFGPITVETINKLRVRNALVKVKEDQQSIKSNIIKEMKEFDYAIITALEEDEMEKVLPLIQKEGIISDSEHLIEYGYVKGMPSKKVVYASQHSTGVIDAGILSTELLLKFKPKFLIMVGVLGGKPLETNIGDVIVASKVFTIDKGKISDLGFQKEINQAAMQSKELARFNREKSQIENFIDDSDPTRKSNINIHFGPIATVNQVIDVEGFFEKEISSIDRKAIALEMESYAVVRACELISRNTKPLIIKSVMDNTSGKTDNAKTYAAWTSAKVFRVYTFK